MFGLLASLAASWRRAAAVIVAWIVVGVVVIVAAPPLGDVTTNNQEDFLPSDSESRRALELVTEKFPRGQGVPAIIVFHRSEGLSDSDLAAVAGVDAVLQSDSAPDEIQSVLSLSGSPEAAGALQAPDGNDRDHDRHARGLAEHRDVWRGGGVDSAIRRRLKSRTSA